MSVYFVRAHVCLSVSVDVAFYFKLGFGRDVGLSLYLDFGGRGFESVSSFWGTWIGVCILIWGDVGLSLDFVFWRWGLFI